MMLNFILSVCKRELASWGPQRHSRRSRLGFREWFGDEGIRAKAREGRAWPQSECRGGFGPRPLQRAVVGKVKSRRNGRCVGRERVPKGGPRIVGVSRRARGINWVGMRSVENLKPAVVAAAVEVLLVFIGHFCGAALAAFQQGSEIWSLGRPRCGSANSAIGHTN